MEAEKIFGNINVNMQSMFNNMITSEQKNVNIVNLYYIVPTSFFYDTNFTGFHYPYNPCPYFLFARRLG
jgi:hypothetical protein